MVGRLVDHVFDGSAGQLVMHLMQDGQLDAEELATIRWLIDDAGGPKKKASRKGAKTQRKRKAEK